MDRISITKNINRLLDDSCESCKINPSRVFDGKTTFAERQHQCTHICPVGQELQRLGSRLEELSNNKRSEKRRRLR